MYHPVKSDAWMPLWVGDYLADTRRLNTTQHGAYLLLIMDYWRNGPPPNDDSILSRITLSSLEDWIKLRPAIEPFFTTSNGTWNHKRIDLELETSRIKYSARCQQTLSARNARLSYVSSVTDNVHSQVHQSPALPTNQHPDASSQITPTNYSNISVTDNVTNNVTSSVTKNVTTNVTSVQSQSQSPEENKRGTGGVKRISPNVLSIQNQTELKRVESRMETVRSQATVTASGKSFTQPQLTELSILKSRRQQLLDSLGFKA